MGSLPAAFFHQTVIIGHARQASMEKGLLRPGAPMGAALAAMARDVLAEARGAIDDPARSETEAVHDFRKAMKRWRALLRLLEPFLGEPARELRFEARDLARELAVGR